MSDFAKIEGDEIVVRIPVSKLSGAAYQGLEYFDLDEDDVDWNALSVAMVSELNIEEEDGTTLVNRMLDHALINVGETGSTALPE